MLEEILIPTDGSDEADIAIDHGLDLAERFDATAHVLHVIDVQKTETAPHSEAWREAGEEYVASVVDEANRIDVAIESDVRTGYPAECILNYVGEYGIDLVTMGTHGRTGVRRYVLGSVAGRVVRLADAPVLTVRLTEETPHYYPYENILVPTDGSDGAATATEWAVNVAARYDATIHALSVVDPTSLGLDVRSVERATPLEEAAEKAVEDVTAAADAAGLEATGIVRTGNPYREIQSYVDDTGIDMVVMGTSGRSDLERYILGGVTDRTVRTSRVPVVSARHGSE